MKKILIPVLLISLLPLISCNSEEPTNATRTYTIKYLVEGTCATADITYNNSNDDTSQAINATLPWEYTFTCEEGFFLYVSAQNNCDSGSITTTIYKSNKVYKTSTSSGAYCIATSSGTAE